MTDGQEEVTPERPTEEQLTAKLEEIVKGNQQKLRWLVQEHAPVDSGQVALMRLNLLMDSLGISTYDRLTFEVQFEELMTGFLDYMASAVTKAKFTNPNGVDLSQFKMP